MLQLQSVTNWGGAKKLALQSITKGGVTALLEGYVIYGRSLNQKKDFCHKKHQHFAELPTFFADRTICSVI